MLTQKWTALTEGTNIFTKYPNTQGNVTLQHSCLNCKTKIWEVGRTRDSWQLQRPGLNSKPVPTISHLDRPSGGTGSSEGAHRTIYSVFNPHPTTSTPQPNKETLPQSYSHRDKDLWFHFKLTPPKHKHRTRKRFQTTSISFTLCPQS